jgi:hypothetical protein
MIGVAKCFTVSKRAVFRETNWKFSLSKLAQEPVVKSASLVPIAKARSVSLERLFADLSPSPPMPPYVMGVVFCHTSNTHGCCCNRDVMLFSQSERVPLQLQNIKRPHQK